MMNHFAKNQTPHNSVRFYVEPENERLNAFLLTVCLWGGHDHEINGLQGYEVTNYVAEAVEHLLKVRFSATEKPEVIY